MIIAISGKAESGKTHTANILKNLIPNSEIIPLASTLKEIAKNAGWTGEKDEKGRTFLQELGRVIKNYNGLDFFARKLLEKADLSKTIIVDDLRMPEELKAFQKHPLITIRVERPFYENSLTPEQRKDRSETGLDNADFDYTLWNNGTEIYDVIVKDFYRENLISCP